MQFKLLGIFSSSLQTIVLKINIFIFINKLASLDRCTMLFFISLFMHFYSFLFVWLLVFFFFLFFSVGKGSRIGENLGSEERADPDKNNLESLYRSQLFHNTTWKILKAQQNTFEIKDERVHSAKQSSCDGGEKEQVVCGPAKTTIKELPEKLTSQ